MELNLLIVALAAVVVAWAVTGRLVVVLERKGLLDKPNERSSHTRPTPRGGGIGLGAGVVFALAAAALSGLPAPPLALVTLYVLVALIGFWDDKSGGLSSGLRFGLQVAAALGAVYVLGPLETLPLPAPFDWSLGWFGIPVTVFWIVAVLNIYNFLDGIDGYAGAQAMVAGAALAMAPLPESARVTASATAGSALGFLIWNWHPARIFMGDVGSTMLGFLFATLPLAAPAAERSHAVILTALCLWFFLADGAFTMADRLRQGERVWEAHRRHLYQRLTRTGLRHSQVTAPLACAMAVLSALALAAWRRWGAPALWPLLALACCFLVLYWLWVRVRERGVIA